MDTLLLDGETLSLENVREVAGDRRRVALHPEAARKMSTSRTVVEAIVNDGRIVYGISTGFGKLSDVHIGHEQLTTLQHNLVRSHASGIGDPLSEEEVRSLILLRANVLAKGLSGARPVVAERLCELLNHHFYPVIPCRGSVGASGDLAPMAHLALVLIGEGEVFSASAKITGREALQAIGLQPLELQAKEGLALLNGTQATLATGLVCWWRARQLLDLADLAGAMSLEALKGTPQAFAERRIERLLNPEYGDLPAFLADNPGLNSGFMIAQVAAAALASENKVLSHPASVDSIPTSGNKEDHVPMAMGAALKLRPIVANLERILAIEFLCAAQGIDYLRPLKAGITVESAYQHIRRHVSHLSV